MKNAAKIAKRAAGSKVAALCEAWLDAEILGSREDAKRAHAVYAEADAAFRKSYPSR